MADASTEFRHEMPDSLRAILDGSPALNARWADLTDLARNEWICWMTLPKKQETRDKHLARLQEDVLAGKRRPCCWPGCPHRRQSAQKWFKN
ncbi:YdeI/OmpD-associated family protein [Sphingomonas sp. HDW15A]|uniref:YdeI/OmpD-associated family protein n=1 Tax=Sphingomonas sp. HDW15A TaxID=2714942 RepID=UPI001F0D1048|nr:YdeI/OmpD-associated family protein [Sphingomonas sp. HDW15A]